MFYHPTYTGRETPILLLENVVDVRELVFGNLDLTKLVLGNKASKLLEKLEEPV